MMYNKNSKLRRALNAFEKSYIVNALKSHNWNISLAAEYLEVDRKHIQRKIKKFKILLPRDRE